MEGLLEPPLDVDRSAISRRLLEFRMVGLLPETIFSATIFTEKAVIDALSRSWLGNSADVRA